MKKLNFSVETKVFKTQPEKRMDRTADVSVAAGHFDPSEWVFMSRDSPDDFYSRDSFPDDRGPNIVADSGAIE